MTSSLKRSREGDVPLVPNFINGEYKASSTGKVMDVLSPSTGEAVAQVTLSGPVVSPFSKQCAIAAPSRFRSAQYLCFRMLQTL